MNAFARELDTARVVALEAAALVRRYRGPDIKVQLKIGDEPVTEADHAANALIVGRLRDAFPRDAVLSEELPDDETRLHADRVWMVDPIDGTRDFIRGDDGFAVMIGLAVEGRPRVGVVCQPAAARTYLGAAGAGAWREQTDGTRVALRTSSLAAPPGIRLVASKSHRNERIDALRTALEIRDEINVGSVGLKMGLVAAGDRDLYVYPGSKTKLWDTCGPEAILDASGGRVSDLDGHPLRYTGAELTNRRGIIASNGPLHALVVAKLAAAGI